MSDKCISELDNCPECGTRWTYTENGKEYSNVIGFQDYGKYDGICYWVCPKCYTYWDRFTQEKLGEIAL